MWLSAASNDHYIVTSYVLFIVFESVTLLLTLLKAKEYRAETKLIRAVFFGSIAFYVLILVISIITVTVVPASVVNSFGFIHRNLHSIIIGHIILISEELCTKQMNPKYFQLLRLYLGITFQLRIPSKLRTDQCNSTQNFKTMETLLCLFYRHLFRTDSRRMDSNSSFTRIRLDQHCDPNFIAFWLAFLLHENLSF